ncbi:DDHD-domain-containing protein [Dothidotthia symphoricarpi CBS 119687]|uniref:DDHD-domain-containing protein n=1 Tax=Dothidotthia symphoricarpi CBS 119687 TaxID=1392245 RepID=A0A6A6ASE3_9PLEO|nr:DDHD-domain-containing protein [Dothidotthia symphoricarpi CBS 119687]KAF2134869.1 DDHD-domain-containing protein [Dothidotthia symphoricarpi CBS 119687]
MSTPDNKPGFLSNLSPWGSRSVTPKPPPTPRDTEEDQEKDKGKERETLTRGLGSQRGGDHIVDRRPRLSLKKYPQDCPALAVRWFHAVDLPKRKPFSENAIKPDKPLPKPKKWIPFSTNDSRAVEAAFQHTADKADAAELRKGIGSSATPNQPSQDAPTPTKVPVNEDYLYDVEIETRELAPTYWLGPVYDVKRGTWFTPDGEPVDEGLAMQLEEGYLKVRPWRFGKDGEKRSASQPRARPTSMGSSVGEEYRKELASLNRDSSSNPVTPKTSMGNLRGEASKEQDETKPDDKPMPSTAPETSRTHRLFGAHMNSTVTYQDENTAWLLTDDMWTRMGSTLYQRFAGGAHYAGYRYVRGYTDLKEKKKPVNAAVDPNSKESERPLTPSLAYGSDNGGQPISSGSEDGSDDEMVDQGGRESPSQTRRRNLERQVSSLMTSSKPEYELKEEEEMRKLEEKEMREDYKNRDKGEQGREIEHLLLVTHGIGQRLGMRMESINFIHDVNTMRKALKSVYANSPDLQALNSEVDTDTKNSRIQVIPIVWRHLLDFPQQSIKHNRKEHDLGDLDHEDHEFPSLEDITVEGIPAVRNFLTDLALDILLYQSPAYKGHISRIVVNEMNRSYRLFKERNPSFKGKVSLVGHSLGSAIMFDILCIQKDAKIRSESHSSKHQRRIVEEGLKLDFEVEDFYALGSPIGLFQMLKGRTIAARPSNAFVPPETPATPLDDPFSPTAAERNHAFDITTSSPLCKQIFNIFHPTDPISYRIEPLISPSMSALKAQPLPYTKKGIFGAPASQGLTGIGARVGQGVTDFWTSIGSGIASGLLNRSLGITGNETTRGGDSLQNPRTAQRLPLGRSTTYSAEAVLGSNEPTSAFINDERRRRLEQETIAPGEEGEHPPTLIESDIETLFAGFQKVRKNSALTEDGKRNVEKDLEWQELEERSRKLRKEEAKVRALNANGRVDFSIQEGAFDISLLASIASHLAYWADEDVSHFMISQLLARHRVFKAKSTET